MGHRNIFGRPRPVPEHDGSAPGNADDDLYADDAGPEARDNLDEDDLELPGTGSLMGISIKRNNNESGMARPAIQPVDPAHGASREQAPPRDIAEYWRRLRKGRRWPPRSDIDPKQLTHWSNTMLMRVGIGHEPWRFESLFADALRGGGQSFGNGDIEFTPMIMDWILDLGRRTEHNGTVVEDTDSFPTKRGDKRYKATAVPLGDDDTTVNYILCHIEVV